MKGFQKEDMVYCLIQLCSRNSKLKHIVQYDSVFEIEVHCTVATWC
jgi:hypothetical protein